MRCATSASSTRYWTRRWDSFGRKLWGTNSVNAYRATPCRQLSNRRRKNRNLCWNYLPGRSDSFLTSAGQLPIGLGWPNSLLGGQNVHGGSFSGAEIQLLLLTNTVTISCDWEVAFHTALGLKPGLDPADVKTIRERQVRKPQCYAALSRLAKTLIREARPCNFKSGNRDCRSRIEPRRARVSLFIHL
jgi:hypothetical protein